MTPTLIFINIGYKAILGYTVATITSKVLSSLAKRKNKR